MTNLRDAPVPWGEELGQLCPDAVFYMLEDERGILYWAKRWLNDRERLLAPTLAIERFLATLDRNDLCLAVEVHEQFGLVYPFKQELFVSKAIVHQSDCRAYFASEERRAIMLFSAILVSDSALPSVRLGELTDFQATRTSEGLMFLDFEPSRRYAATLAKVQIP
ncbi:MAG TPA: hypothetical protein VNM47_14335 [Terriglobia bacterium]|nr:hypothetical protein [Terriglobia bacterium]